MTKPRKGQPEDSELPIVTSRVLAERAAALHAQTASAEPSSAAPVLYFGADLSALLRPGECLHSNRRGPVLTGVEPRCADCGNLFDQQEVRACDYCVRYVCISCWPDHTCDGKRLVDTIMRKEWANIEYKVQAFSADMDPLERARRIEHLVWERIHYYLEEWANESQHAEEMERGMKVVQRLLEELEQVKAELAAAEQSLADSKKAFPNIEKWTKNKNARHERNGHTND